MVTATVRVGYSTADDVPDRPIDDPGSSQDPTGQVLIEIPPQFAFDGLIIRVYPTPDIVAASAGTLTPLGSRVFTTTDEIVPFRGSPRSRISRPGAFAVVMAPIGDLFALDGADLIGSENLSLGFDPAVNEIVVRNLDGDPVSAYGAVQVGYSARYERYRYEPGIDLDGGYVYGSVVAMKDTGVAVKSIDPPQRSNESPDWIKLWEVYSEIVLDPEDTWEKPPNFPDSNAYPAGIEEGPDTEVYLIDRRIHEIGYLHPSGRIDSRQYARTDALTWERPYRGSSNYRPAYLFSRLTAAPTGFSRAYTQADWGSIARHILARYGLMTI